MKLNYVCCQPVSVMIWRFRKSPKIICTDLDYPIAIKFVGGLVMRHISLFAAAGLLAVVLGGCGGSTPDPSVGQPPSAAPVPASPAPGTQSPVAQAPAGTQPFAQPTTAASPAAPAGNLPPDLISSTDADQRLRSIQRNRPDPFALLPTTPVVERTETNTSPATPIAPVAPAPVNSNNGGGTIPAPELEPADIPPPPPQTDLAQAVQVTGVVQIGNTIHAIVKAPDEPTSRYVRAGQYLSNGQVLVKRIDVSQAEPVVVFEQNGVEIITSVGSGGPPSEPGQPAAAAIASSQIN